MKSTYETELDWCIDGGMATASALVEYVYLPQQRGGRWEPDYLASVTIKAVRVAKRFGNAVTWHDILSALPDEIVEHLQLRVLEDIRANRADYEYDASMDARVDYKEEDRIDSWVGA